MPFNLSNISSWIANVRGLLTTDQLEGGSGGVMNMGLQDLTSRTQFLFDRLETTFKGFIEANTAAPPTITAAQMGNAYIVNGTTGGSLTLPLGSTMPTDKPAGFYFIHNDATAGSCIRIVRTGSDQIAAGASLFTDFWLKPGMQVWLLWTGTNWRVIGDDRLSQVGIVEAMAANIVRPGHLECAGQVVSRTTYRDLFTVIGTTWGLGDGVNTFQLPDLRGLFLRGFNTSVVGLDAGRIFAEPQNDRVGSHYHFTGEFTASTDDNWRAIYAAGQTDGESYTKRQVTGESSLSSISGTLNSFATKTGREVNGGGFGENRVNNQTVLYQIKY